jgi:hypothetical protein
MRKTMKLLSQASWSASWEFNLWSLKVGMLTTTLYHAVSAQG